MDLIKSWLPTIVQPTLSNQRPAANAANQSHHRSHGHNSVSSSQRLENCRLLISRFSQNLFAAAHRSHAGCPPTAARPRQTIQTDYISTISSLVDRNSSSETNPPDPATVDATIATTQALHDAQSANFGLYALKCNRSNRSRRPPQIPTHRKQWQQPMADTDIEDTSDLVGEQMIIRLRRPPDRPPVPTLRITPRKARAPLQPPSSRPAERVPRITLVPPSPRSMCAQAELNSRSMLELDTVFLDPLLVETTEPLQRPAETIAVIEQSATDRSELVLLPTVNLESPAVVCQVATTIKQSQTPTVIVRCQRADHFANFTAELGGSPVVEIGPAGGQQRTEYVERFARAFTAAFSEEEGCEDGGDEVDCVLDEFTSAPMSMMRTTAQQQVDHKSVVGCPQSDLIKSSDDIGGDDDIEQSWGAEAMLSFAALAASNGNNNNTDDIAAAAASCGLLPAYGGVVEGGQWEQITPLSHPFVCSPILEVLNDELYSGGDDDEDGRRSNSSSDAHPSVDNDINDNSICGPAQLLVPLSSSVTAARTDRQSGAADSRPHTYDAYVRPDDINDNYYGRSMLVAGGELDSKAGTCSVGAHVIVRRTVYIVDL